jgi:hypothetical protein
MMQNAIPPAFANLPLKERQLAIAETSNKNFLKCFDLPCSERHRYAQDHDFADPNGECSRSFASRIVSQSVDNYRDNRKAFDMSHMDEWLPKSAPSSWPRPSSGAAR